MSGSPSPLRPPPVRPDDKANKGGGGHSKTISWKFELTLLLSILAGLCVLAFRPFGFRTFLSDLSHGEIYPMAILVGILAVIFVIMQRFGIIFDNPENYSQ
ncbi:MAG: hypothetical protein M3270_01015 [Thermoproteota archaeon]|nr:hypothetical protein [Thermoproteota archaeon]